MHTCSSPVMHDHSPYIAVVGYVRGPGVPAVWECGLSQSLNRARPQHALLWCSVWRQPDWLDHGWTTAGPGLDQVRAGRAGRCTASGPRATDRHYRWPRLRPHQDFLYVRCALSKLRKSQSPHCATDIFDMKRSNFPVAAPQREVSRTAVKRRQKTAVSLGKLSGTSVDPAHSFPVVDVPRSFSEL